MALQRPLTYLYMPSDVLRGDAGQQIRFRRGSMVAKDSLQRTCGMLENRCSVTAGNTPLQVRYVPILPDLF